MELVAMIDLSGRQYGRLTVARKAERPPHIRNTNAYWLCRCVCGNTTTVSGSDLRNKKIRSCGCLLRDFVAERGAIAAKNAPTYRIWFGMLDRCRRANNKSYPYYGGRGIKVCDRWQVFGNFLADMGHRPNGMTLDRINSDGDYEPGNCRWATRAEQSANTRRAWKCVVGDQTMTLSQRCEHAGIHITTALRRHKRGVPMERLFLKGDQRA